MSETSGLQQTPVSQAAGNAHSKSFIAAWLFSLFLSVLGVDRFYLGKVGTGILKLITFGGAGIWYIIDVILLLADQTVDKQRVPLAGRVGKEHLIWVATGVFFVVVVIASALSSMHGMSAGYRSPTMNMHGWN